MRGQVDFSGAQVTGDLSLQSAEIGGDLFCQPEGGQRTEIGGKAWLAGAKVRGQVDFSGAQVTGDLSLQSAEIGGGLFCQPEGGQRTEIGGKASLAGAKVTGAVVFSGAQVTGDLSLQGAEIGGGLFCRPADDQRTEIGGKASLAGAKVTGVVVFSGAQFAGDLSLHNAVVEGDLTLDGRSCPDGKIDLTRARVEELKIVDGLPPQVDTEGFRFQQIAFQRITLPDDRCYLKLLESSHPFRKSSYLFMENWLRNRGDDRSANHIYRHMRRRDRGEGKKGIFARLGDWILDWTIGYGTASYRLGIYFLLIIVATTWLFSRPEAAEPPTARRRVGRRAHGPTGAIPCTPHRRTGRVSRRSRWRCG